MPIDKKIESNNIQLVNGLVKTYRPNYEITDVDLKKLETSVGFFLNKNSLEDLQTVNKNQQHSDGQQYIINYNEVKYHIDDSMLNDDQRDFIDELLDNKQPIKLND